MESGETDASQVLRMPLKALRLRPGMAVQTRRLVEGASKKESQYFGAIEGKGVMVGPMGPDGVKTELVDGEVCIVRGFTGQYEYSFLSKVLQVFEKPFAYALLAYPAQVDARKVRQSMRTRASWPTQAGAAGETPVEVALVDISPFGAMVRAPRALAPVGAALEIIIEAMLGGAPQTLRLNAQVCHSHQPMDDAVFIVGMAFAGLGTYDKQTLELLIKAATPDGA